MGLTVSDAYVISQITHDLMSTTNNQDTLAVFLGEPTSHVNKHFILEVLSPSNEFIELHHLDALSNHEIVPARIFFRCLGYNKSASIDVSDYEGSEHIVDLNTGHCPDALFGKADFIYDTGTLEHIFNLPNALKIINEMLRIGGTVFHSNPSNQMIDHGFYQISPTFYRSYYSAARYEHVFGGLSKIYPKASKIFEIDIYRRDIYRSNGGHVHTKTLPPLNLLYAAKKTEHSAVPVSCIQEHYSANPDGRYLYNLLDKNEQCTAERSLAQQLKSRLPIITSAKRFYNTHIRK